MRQQSVISAPGSIRGLLFVHLLCRDQLQHPVNPDLLDPSMGYRANVGQVQLLVQAQVILVGLDVGQWGASEDQRNTSRIMYFDMQNVRKS